MSFGIVAGVVGSIAGAIITGNAAEDAAQIQADASTANNQVQRDIYNQQRTDQGPWREAGGRALNAMSYGLGLGELTGGGVAPQPRASTLGGFLSAADAGVAGPAAEFYNNQITGTPGAIGGRVGGLSPGEFNTPFGEAAPRPQDIANDPGYQFRMQQGQQALERSASSRGRLLSGGTMKDLTAYSQGMASQEYQNAYSRYQDAFNRFQTDRTARYNRLASLSGSGQTANVALGAAGQNYANQVGLSNSNAADAASDAAGRTATGWNTAIGSIGQTLRNSSLFQD